MSRRSAPASAGSRPAPPRTGPRPLALHLGIAMMAHAGALAAAPAAAAGVLPALPGRGDPESFAPPLSAAALPAWLEAVGGAATARMQGFLDGVARYRAHPYRRGPVEPPAVWQEGATRLLDYGGSGPALLVVPSLINRYHVLDLLPEHSLLRWLAGRGFHPYVVDWGAPAADERGLDLAACVGRLQAALAHLARQDGRAPFVVGYCMGGTLAVALAARAEIRGLALLAAPWDFHADGEAATYRGLAQAVAPVLAACGELPVDVMQALFLGLDPLLGLRKFRRLAALPPGGAAERRFVALEDWLNEGAPLPAPLAWECLFGWYAENRPGAGRWRLDGDLVDPAAIRVPALVAVPRADRIVPPASARALAGRLPGAAVLRPPAGHIGMVVGGGAEAALWQPLAAWLRAVAAA